MYIFPTGADAKEFDADSGAPDRAPNDTETSHDAGRHPHDVALPHDQVMRAGEGEAHRMEWSKEADTSMRRAPGLAVPGPVGDHLMV